MLSLLLLFFIATAFAQDDLQARKDSLRLALTQMQGSEKIDTYSRLATCYMMEVEDNLKMDTLFTLYEEMYEEAVMQGDFKSCGISMERRVSAYFNTRRYKEVFRQAPGWMDFLAKHEEWSNYYLIVNTLVMSYTQMSESDNALNLAQEMYEQAKQQQYNAGIGIMLQSIGFIYLMQDRYEESENFFRQSIELLQKEKDQVSFLLRTYLYLTQPLRPPPAIPIYSPYPTGLTAARVPSVQPLRQPMP
ncbi:hypothetical protein AGMMS49574_13580 [Bacteroidia bacterium]|nr:hypothetical protein AGMMS49574_13580 [Bacteroidia bacterium]